jgi:hypothetical protein
MAGPSRKQSKFAVPPLLPVLGLERPIEAGEPGDA